MLLILFLTNPADPTGKLPEIQPPIPPQREGEAPAEPGLSNRLLLVLICEICLICGQNLLFFPFYFVSS